MSGHISETVASSTIEDVSLCPTCGRFVRNNVNYQPHQMHQLQMVVFRFVDVETQGSYEVVFMERRYSPEYTQTGEYVVRIEFETGNGMVVRTNRPSIRGRFTPEDETLAYEPLSIGALISDQTGITLQRAVPDPVQCDVNVLLLVLMDGLQTISLTCADGPSKFQLLYEHYKPSEVPVQLEGALVLHRPSIYESDPFDHPTDVLEIVSRWLIAVLDDDLGLFNSPWKSVRATIARYVEEQTLRIDRALTVPYLSLEDETNFLYSLRLNDSRLWWWDLWRNLSLFAERNSLKTTPVEQHDDNNTRFFSVGARYMNIFIRGFDGPLVLHTTPEIEKRGATFH